MAVKVPVTLSPVDSKKVDAAIARIQSQAKGVSFAGGARSLEKLSRPLGKITGQATEFKKSLDASNARVLAFGASVAVINKLSEAFAGLVSNTIKVEASFAKIGVILGGTEQQLRQFGNGIFDVAKKTATSFDQVADGALELARQGLSVEESLSRVETALKLVRVAGIDSQEAVAGLTAAIKGFEGAGLTVAQIADKLAEVDTKFAVSTEDLINGLERASASARVAGVSFDELLGLITTVQERTQRGGAVIGNAFKTIFARLGRNDTLVALKDLGIEVLDVEGNVRAAVPLFVELAAELDKLGLKSTEAGDIIQRVAGVRQRDILISLVEDLNSGQSQFAKSLQVSAGAAGALDSKNEKLNQTLEALISNVKTSAQELAALFGDIGFTDTAGDILRTFSSVLGSLKDLFDGEGLGSTFARGIVKGIGGVLTGPGLALVTAIFIKLFVDLAKFGVTSLKQILGINKAAADQKILQQSILQTLLQNENIQREILALEGNKVAQEQLLLRIYNDQAAALARVSKAAATVTPGLFGAGFRGGERGIRKTGRGAGGYVAAEARDVSRGVGGATAGSKIVSIPNFSFGRGRRGTMIANSSEYFVPNYSGGGDAIFNRDMIKTMGLPSGARKINAAGGYIPNFAAIKDPRFAMIVPSERGTQNVEGISSSKTRYQFPVVGYRDDLLEAKNDIQLKSDVEDAAIRIATLEAKTITNNDPQPTFLKKGDLNPGAVGGLAGTVFEAIVSALIKGPQFDLAKTATFDFIGASAAKNLRDGLFPDLSSAAEFIEAKINAGSDLRKSMADKIEKFREGPKTLTKAGIAEISRSVRGRPFKGRREKKDFLESPISSQEFPTTFGGARGFIPNFVGGLEDAIAREEAAGVPINQIRVNQSGKLRNAQNPKGLAVTNTKDEPTGRIPNFQQGGSSAIDRLSNAALGASTALFFLSSAFSGSESALGNFISKVAGAASVLTGLTLLKAPLDALSIRLATMGTGFGRGAGGIGPQTRGASALSRGIAGVGRALPGIGTAIGIGAVVAPLILELTKTKTGFEELNRELQNIDLSKLATGDVATLQQSLSLFEAQRQRQGVVDKELAKPGAKGETPAEIFANSAKEFIRNFEVLNTLTEDPGDFTKTSGLGGQGLQDIVAQAIAAGLDVDAIFNEEGVTRIIEGGFRNQGTIGARSVDDRLQVDQAKLLDQIIIALKQRIEDVTPAVNTRPEGSAPDAPLISQETAIERTRSRFRTVTNRVTEGAATAETEKRLQLLRESSEVEKASLENDIAKAKIIADSNIARLASLQAITEEALTANEAKDVDETKLALLLAEVDENTKLVDLEAQLLELTGGNKDAARKIASSIKDGADAAFQEKQTKLDLLAITNELAFAEAQRAEASRLASISAEDARRTLSIRSQAGDLERRGRGEKLTRELQGGVVSPERSKEIQFLQQELELEGQVARAKEAVAQAQINFNEAFDEFLLGGGTDEQERLLNNQILQLDAAQDRLKTIQNLTKAQSEFNKKQSEKSGIEIGFESVQQRLVNFNDEFGKRVPMQFANILGSAMSNAIQNGGDLGDVLEDAGKRFLQLIAEAALQAAALSAVGGFGKIFGFGGGGEASANIGGLVGHKGIQSFSLGGKVSARDTVPAMLTPGEFVMSKPAVDRYGSEFLQNLNQGQISQTNSTETGSGVSNQISLTFNISNSQGGEESERDFREQGNFNAENNLVKRLRTSVIQIIGEESRPGGALYGG